jgi:hypothetical protein
MNKEMPQITQISQIKKYYYSYLIRKPPLEIISMSKSV